MDPMFLPMAMTMWISREFYFHWADQWPPVLIDLGVDIAVTGNFFTLVNISESAIYGQISITGRIFQV